tara:strand:- start:14 stop:526 length:513 start_codon:yes stop_codon:yes gene_type:complete
MFDIPLSKSLVKKQLSQYQKINYNQFRWWRMYQPKNKPLDNRKPLRDRIFNGDFDYSCYKAQQYLVEYQLNDILKECDNDYGKYLEKTSVIRARRKRLMEDFEKDEAERLNSLTVEFTKYFKCNREQAEEEMLKCSGSLIDLYYIIEDKYKIVHMPVPLKRRGRPKKLSI